MLTAACVRPSLRRGESFIGVVCAPNATQVSNEVFMNNTKKQSLIALVVLIVSFLSLTIIGQSGKRPILRLPDETTNLGLMSKHDLDRALADNPRLIHKLTFYKGVRMIVADVDPLGPTLVDYGKTNDLLSQARTAHVKIEILNPVSTTSDWLASVDSSLWIMLAACGLAIVFFCWREGLLSRVPGLEQFSPVDTGSDAESTELRTFDDVAGCEESIAKLKRVARWLESPGWYEQFGAQLPRGILAVGPPGTGKTLLARALAGEVNANFFSVHASSFVEMFVGVGARRIRKLFASAAAAHKRTGKPSIIFIDEIDAIGKKRSQGGSGAETERDQTLNQLLVCMQGFDPSKGILVMAATNMADTLDEALTRPGRFDYHVSVDLPDTLGREKIFSIHTRNMRLAPNIKLREFAVRTPQFSGADIEQACNEAAIAAAERVERVLEGKAKSQKISEDDKIVTLEDFDQGIDYVQFGDPMLSRARSMTELDKRNTAYHEAGHSVVQQALQNQGADPITKVTIEPRSKSLGSMQSHAQGDRYSYTEEQLLARITTAMGGRAAQELFLGRRDTGASNDFEQASNLARLMVTEFGLSRLGPILVRQQNNGGRNSAQGEELANAIDAEWRRILDECYKKAVTIIMEHNRRVELIAEALLAEQTLLGNRFIELWDMNVIKPSIPECVITSETGN